MSMATVRFFPSIFFAWESQTKIRWETVPNLLTPGRQGQNGPECNFICAIVGVQGIRWKGKSSHVNVPPLVQHEQTLDLTQYLFCAAWISAYQLGMHSKPWELYFMYQCIWEYIHIYLFMSYMSSQLFIVVSGLSTCAAWVTNHHLYDHTQKHLQSLPQSSTSVIIPHHLNPSRFHPFHSNPPVPPPPLEVLWELLSVDQVQVHHSVTWSRPSLVEGPTHQQKGPSSWGGVGSWKDGKFHWEKKTCKYG